MKQAHMKKGKDSIIPDVKETCEKAGKAQLKTCIQRIKECRESGETEGYILYGSYVDLTPENEKELLSKGYDLMKWKTGKKNYVQAFWNMEARGEVKYSKRKWLEYKYKESAEWLSRNKIIITVFICICSIYFLYFLLNCILFIF